MIQIAQAQASAAREVNNAQMEAKIAGMMDGAAADGAAGGAAVAEEPDTLAPVMDAIAMQHQQFMEAMSMMMASLQAKKDIQIRINPQTGRIDGATVTPQ